MVHRGPGAYRVSARQPDRLATLRRGRGAAASILYKILYEVL